MHNGGEGVVRDIEFLEPIQCSILSERRVYHPYGLEGGGDGACGQNLWIKQRREKDGDLRPDGKEDRPPRVINLGGKQTVAMGAGDRIVVKTPGGGAWGKVGQEKVASSSKPPMDRGSARGSHADRLSTQEGSS